jgi:hypothetical protein
MPISVTQIKAARVLWIIGIILALFGALSIYIALTAGDKMLLSLPSSNAVADRFEAQIAKAKAGLADLKSHLALSIGLSAASVACGVAGYIGARQRRRGPAFFALEGICFALTALCFVQRSFLLGAVYALALALGFLKITALTKGGAVIPED